MNPAHSFVEIGFFKNLKIRTKVLFGFIIPALFLWALSLITYRWGANLSDRIVTVLFLFSFMYTLIAILMAILISKVLLRSIGKVQQAAYEIAYGNTNKKIEIESNDEIGALASTINQMFDRILAYEKELEGNNSELNTKISELEESKKAMIELLEDLHKEKARAEEARIKDETILAGIGDGVFAIDRSEKLILFNKAAAEISGYTQEEAMGKPYKEILRFMIGESDFIRDDFVKKALNGIKTLMLNHTELITKSARRVPVSDRAAPLLGSDNSIQGAVIVFRDVTKEKQLEKLKDGFVSLASHELRTPMTAVKGLVSMIKEGDYGPINKSLNEPLNDIFASVDRLIHLVNDMLDVSRIEAGRLKVEIRDFDLKGVIEEVVSSLQPIAKGKNISLQANNLKSVMVQGDADKLKQILDNLIGNALKFTEKGKVVVEAKQVEEKMNVYVIDTGTGISEEEWPKLFKKFAQINYDPGDRPIGTGLGLYLSRAIAMRLGGELWIEHSEIGKGSSFAFSIPLSGSRIASEISFKVRQEAEAPTTISFDA